MGVPPIPFAYRSRYGNSIADLMLQRGDVASRGAARSGALWGQAVSQLGQIGADVVRERGEERQAQEVAAQEEEARAQRTAVFGEILNDPRTFEDPQYALSRLSAAGYEPSQALPLAQAFQAFGQAQGETDPNKAMEYVPTLAGGYVAAEEDARPLLLDPLKQWLTSANLVPEGGWENVSPEQFLSVAQSYAPPPEAAEGPGYGTPEWQAGASPEDLATYRGNLGATAAATRPPLSRIEAEAAATTRGTVAGRPPEAPGEEGPGAWGTATTDAERKRISSMRYGLKKLPGLIKFLKDNPEAIGPIEGRMTKFQQKWGVRASEKIAEREAELAVLRNAIVNALSGVAVNPQEFERIKEQIPNITDSEPMYRGKLTILQEYFEDSLASFGLSPPGDGGGGQVIRYDAQGNRI